MTVEQLKEYIQGHFPVMMTLLDTGRVEPMYQVKPGQLVEVCRALRDDEKLRFDYLCNLGGVDTGEHFEVVYSIASTQNGLRLDFKVILPYDQAGIESVQDVWPGAGASAFAEDQSHAALSMNTPREGSGGSS